MSNDVSPSSGQVFTPRKLLTRKHLRQYSWLPDVLRVKHSIVGHIIGPVLTVTVFSAGVVYAHDKGKSVTMANSVTPLLAVVVGLILVFRNGTSYDRYYEGRKAFGSISSQARNLARLIWVHVALPPLDDTSGKTPATDITPLQLRRRKIDALKLILSYVYSVKHYLREEDGLEWEDYVGVIPGSFSRSYYSRHQSRRSSASTGYNAMSEHGSSVDNSRPASPGQSRCTSTDGSPSPVATKRVRVKRSTDRVATARSPLIEGHSAIDFQAYNNISIPFPLVIAHEITRMLFAFRRDGLLETVGPAGVNTMNTSVSGLVDQLTNVERIANTPIPKSYGIHLKQCVTLYLFSLPFTLVNELGWATVPIITVVSFTFMGIEGIAEQIEMPFGLDEADLPLDRYCSDLKEEIHYVIEKLPEGGVGGYGWDDGQGDD